MGTRTLKIIEGRMVRFILFFYSYYKSGLSKRKEEKAAKGLCNRVKAIFDTTLLKDPVFLLFLLCNFFGCMGYYIPYIYLPNMARLKGIGEDRSNLLVSVIGISNTIG